MYSFDRLCSSNHTKVRKVRTSEIWIRGRLIFLWTLRYYVCFCHLPLFHAVFIGESKDNLKHEDDMKNEDNLKYQTGSLNIEGLFQQRISSTAMITLVSENILPQISHSLMNY